MPHKRRTAEPVEARAEGALTEIPLASLRTDTVTAFDIYVQTSPDQPTVLYREKNLPFTDVVRQRLTDSETVRVFIDSSQESAYRRYIEQNLPAILVDDSLDVSEKAGILYLSAKGLVAEIMDDPRSGKLLQRSKDFVANTVEFIRGERAAFQHLLKVVSYDYYTYTHSVNVFVFSLVLAQRAGLDGIESFRDFGEGLLLHDIGKGLIDSAIVNRKGKLTEEQWTIMKLHPVYGFDVLVEHGNVGPVALDVVRHHHEKLTGVGYPDGLKGDQISSYARIVTIADIFDALTTRRTYRDAISSFAALKLMKEEMADELDPRLFRVFVAMMGAPEG